LRIHNLHCNPDSYEIYLQTWSLASPILPFQK
jgi:hypothetical protein